jgi:hypothetical protein
MYCGHCGRALIVGTKFCVGCGVPVTHNHSSIDERAGVSSHPEVGTTTQRLPNHAQWLRPIGGSANPDVMSRLDTPLARAAYEILAPYGLTFLVDARHAMPPDQYDHIVGQAQELAVRAPRLSGTGVGRSGGKIAGGNRWASGTPGSGTVVASHAPIPLTILILGVLLGVALAWRGWDIYHAGQVINNATNMLGTLLGSGSQGRQATSILSSITGNPDDYETAGEGIMVAGMACAVGAAFALSHLKVSVSAFMIAAAIALSITGSGAGDVTLFGVAAVALTGLSLYALRKRA